MENNSLKIAFLLGSPDINGGTYVIFEHASRLQVSGHQVSIITHDQVDPERYSWHSSAGQLKWLTLDDAAEKQFDVVLATWWQSPFLLSRFSASHYIYFVQSIESRFFQEENPRENDKRDLAILRDFCESTYSFNIPVITEARWIKDYLYHQYNNSAYLVKNGIRKDIYQKNGDAVSGRADGRLRVLIEGPVDVFYKNVQKSIDLSRQAGVDEVWLLTSSDVQSCPGADQVFSRIPIHDTPAIYRSCDVLVKLSYVEGMFGPPLEMFHCGGTAIVYEVTGHDEYIVHDQNGLVVKRDDDNRVVEYLKELKSNSEYLEKLKQGAEATAQGWPDWSESSVEFVKAIRDVTQGKPVSKNYVQQHTDKIFAAKDNAFAAREMRLFADREKKYGVSSFSDDNFVQLYWHEGEGFGLERFQYFYYTSSGTDIVATFELTANKFPFWIRIDPGVRIGIIEVKSIEISEKKSGKNIMSVVRPDDFDTLTPNGTITRLVNQGKNIYLSYGEDPQLVLPVIEENDYPCTLEIVITLRETGISQFFGASTPGKSLENKNTLATVLKSVSKGFFGKIEK